MAGLLAVGGDQVIAERRAAGRPTLAICVGHQVLFEAGIEHGVRAAGCAVWPGVVERLQAERLPHMGWNTVQPGRAAGCSPVSSPSGSTSCTATVSGRYAAVAGSVVTWAEHDGDRFVAARGGRAALVHPVPPREVRRRRGAADRELGRHAALAACRFPMYASETGPFPRSFLWSTARFLWFRRRQARARLMPWHRQSWLAYCLAKPGAWRDEPWEGDHGGQGGEQDLRLLRRRDPPTSIGLKCGDREAADLLIERYPDA